MRPPFDRRAERERGLELRQLRVALVDRDEVVGLLLSGEVEIRLLVELGDEPVGVLAERVELDVGSSGVATALPRIAAVQEITLKTERKTQLVNITEQVQAALGERERRGAALVYVPHTTAGVTINETPTRSSRRTSRTRSQKIVDDGWDWKHTEDPGRSERAVARARLAHEHADPRPAARRQARARPLAGDLLLRVRRAARPQGLRHDAA